MYTLIVEDKHELRYRIYYDPKKSDLHGHGGLVIDVSNVKTTDIHIQELFDSIQEKRTLDNMQLLKPECMHCPVVHLCKGVIPVGISCDNEYAFFVQKLDFALRMLTGKKLCVIEGYIERP